MSYSQYHCSKSPFKGPSPFKKEEGGEENTETKENKRPLDSFSSGLNESELIKDSDAKVNFLKTLNTDGDAGKEKSLDNDIIAAIKI